MRYVQVVGNRPAYEPDTFRTYDSAYPPEAHMKFSVHGDKGKEIACRIQIPLKLAWAVSS